MDDHARHFLQMMIQHGAVTGAEALKLAQEAAAAAGDERDEAFVESEMEGFVQGLNNKLKPLDMRLKTKRSEKDGTEFYALVNDADDMPSKAATKLDKIGIQYFKKLLHEIVEQGRPLGAIEASNLSSDIDGSFSKQQLRDLIERWVKEGWLIEPTDGDISLGPRAMMELEGYVEKEFAGETDGSGQSVLRKCQITQDTIIYGVSCPKCGMKAFYYALDQFHKNQREACAKAGKPEKVTCPQCKVDWDTATAGSGFQLITRGKPDSSSRSSSRSKRRHIADDDDDDGGELAQASAADPSPPKRAALEPGQGDAIEDPMEDPMHEANEAEAVKPRATRATRGSGKGRRK